MGAFEKLAEVSASLPNDYVREWKDRGRRVIGYVCTYLPEEMLVAMDVLPVRLSGRGVTDTSRADSYLSRVNCSFARCCLEAGLIGRYEFLDGAVFINGCDHIRRGFENWEVHPAAALPFMYLLPVPHRIFPDGLAWFKEEVARLREALEQRFGLRLNEDKLREAIAEYNRARRLIRGLYDLRTADDPPFSGAEALTIVAASTLMPKAAFNPLLEEILSEAGSRPGVGDGKPRLFIAGSLMDDPEFIENVEDLGAIVVSDALCIGARSVWNLVEEEGDPMAALCRRYYDHEPCPRMSGDFKRRLAFVMDQIERSRADGVILEHIKFCDQHGTDNALFKHFLEREGIPVIELERQYGPLADAGRVRTRVQAFLERIG
jgi:bzd-type benzoyl-CoA reductase N subunit